MINVLDKLFSGLGSIPKEKVNVCFPLPSRLFRQENRRLVLSGLSVLSLQLILRPDSTQLLPAARLNHISAAFGKN